jgi:eukaryotic-like serine/threonine-protein kinase
VTAPPSTQRERVILGKYRIEQVISRSSMAEVVVATHLGLKQRVAIKFLRLEVLQQDNAVLRFLQEAQLAAKLQSQHVARVLDVGHLENGAPFIVMEYLEGEDLAAIVARGPLPAQLAVDYVVQACDAMIEAHAAGIVHRDLKPSNLFLASRLKRSPIVKVLDFGIAKLFQDGAGLTRTAAVLGAPAYMSPEQAQSARDVDARSDVWAFGVILFELLSGRTPFVGTSAADIIPQITQAEAPSLGQVQSDVPHQLVAAVARCLQKRPSDRFQSLTALVAEIAHFGTPRSLQIAERAAQSNPGKREASSTATGPVKASKPRGLEPSRLGLIVLAAMVLIGLVVAFKVLGR